MAKDYALVQDLSRFVKISVLAVAAALCAAGAAQPARSAETVAVRPAEREVIPGADRLSSAQREAYRLRMQAAKTAEEQAKIRAEFAKTMFASAPAPLRGDPERGSKLHRACFSCHGIERYTQRATHWMASFSDSVIRASGLSDTPPAEPTRFKGRIQSLEALRNAVTRRNDFFNPKMSPQEVEDVVAYLNATYYKFPQ